MKETIAADSLIFDWLEPLRGTNHHGVFPIEMKVPAQSSAGLHPPYISYTGDGYTRDGDRMNVKQHQSLIIRPPQTKPRRRGTQTRLFSNESAAEIIKSPSERRRSDSSPRTIQTNRSQTRSFTLSFFFLHICFPLFFPSLWKKSMCIGPWRTTTGEIRSYLAWFGEVEEGGGRGTGVREREFLKIRNFKNPDRNISRRRESPEDRRKQSERGVKLPRAS